MAKKLKIITKDHNAEDFKNALLAKKRKLNKFLKLDNDYGDDLPEFIFYSDKHIDDGDYNFEINDMIFTNSFVRKNAVDKHDISMYICSRYSVFLETIKNNDIVINS
jgi:hypothetical protein